MTTTTQPTCQQRIWENLESREVELEEMNGDWEQLSELALSVDTEQLTTITLSWGGPSDFLEVKHSGAEIHGVNYRFSDWWDTAVTKVEKDSPLYSYAQSIIEVM